ncbi:telomere repeats-binding bouquet formation protein 1-like isoform X2 [Denticeps clupeoides]|uniref:telomere repeats-binding bouquet formation protein 1-like isoform X2 n=1 Tax=Denticeps clupeoides TaxID=299321 RepID=UPI0010A559A6|nr:telomere repeats-binding bouquet formation protein 1-like isoform X2 [Denticeps clupeoides]
MMGGGSRKWATVQAEGQRTRERDPDGQQATVRRMAKTDLRLLLERLECQTAAPATQKQALLAICSVCQRHGEDVEFFGEIGGVDFVSKLSRSTTDLELRQTTLFTLARLADSSAYCKQTLCNEETFSDLVDVLQRDVPVTLRRAAVYMLNVLVSNNTVLASRLSRLHLVPELLLLLSRPALEGREQLCVLITVGICTDASDHQVQLLRNGGLALLISLLTESQNDEIRRAATFILQTCRSITEMLTAGLGTSHEVQGNLRSHWSSAGELLHRIQHLEKQQQASDQHWGNSMRNTFGPPLPLPSSQMPVSLSEEFCQGTPVCRVKGHTEKRHRSTEGVAIEAGTSHKPPAKERKRQASEGENNTGQGGKHMSVPAALSSMLPTRRGNHTEDISSWSAEGDKHTDCAAAPHAASPQHKRRLLSDDEMSICSELLDCEIKHVLKSPVSVTQNALRCSGCVLRMCEVNSRSFGALLRSSRFKCETHRLLLGADKCYRGQLAHSLTRAHRNHSLPDKAARTHSSAGPAGHSELGHRPGSGGDHTDVGESLYRTRGVLCTPGGGENGAGSSTAFEFLRNANLTPLKRPCEKKGRERKPMMMGGGGHNADWQLQKRERRNFTELELGYLCKGVRRYGMNWNSILWAYPFHPCRTNVDLAQKYRRLQRAGGAPGLDANV